MGTCTLQWEVALFGFDMLSMGTRGKAGTCSQKLHPKSTPYSCVTPSKSFELSRLLFPKGIIFPSRILFFFKLALFGVRGTTLLGFQPFAPYGQGSSLWSVLHTEGADRPLQEKEFHSCTASESHWTRCCPRALSMFTSSESMETYFLLLC